MPNDYSGIETLFINLDFWATQGQFSSLIYTAQYTEKNLNTWYSFIVVPPKILQRNKVSLLKLLVYLALMKKKKKKRKEKRERERNW